MPRFSEDTLSNWTKPPSDSEETKLSNSERMIRKAINEDPVLSDKSTEVFGQGSYANDTNVRLNSDIDINVRYTGGFYFNLPEGISREDFGLTSPSEYSLNEFKNDVYTALVRKFGTDSVQRKNKCLTVLGNSYRVETDVVPTWNYRRYNKSGGYVLGAKLKADSGESVVNYPKQHIENGKQKNSETNRRFERLTRIYRKLRYKMIDDGFPVGDSITSFLLECLVWNVSNSILNGSDTWQERLKGSIVHLYEHTKDEDKCDEWDEVSELLYLFRGNRKWAKSDVNKFLVDAWNYLGY
ncbi:nucleotidyltransferase [Nitrosococcus wardiae]|uniref:Nucleotidyltransferase n=1 Tax=Nitrosococcus wardiae TaxID=1814290 RepID=A0A4V1AWB0_9GAMM|nr:nucleotidyltransferase [Nitrosococcus wardiae]QBQ56005.1 nucleotidyltransferase [Nitrosococcus wardiae]